MELLGSSDFPSDNECAGNGSTIVRRSYNVRFDREEESGAGDI